MRGGNTSFLTTYEDVMWKTEALNLISEITPDRWR